MSTSLKCIHCGLSCGNRSQLEDHIQFSHGDSHKEISEAAKRDEIAPRYDLIIPEFEHAMATIMGFGAVKYGEFNWKQSRLKNGKSPINHIKHHLQLYLADIQYDHMELGSERRYHLAAIAINAMFEFYYELKGM